MERTLLCKISSVFVLLVVLTTKSLAQVPRTISYQGVANENGKVITGQHTITVTFYDAVTGGNKLFQETHEVDITGGVFDLTLGAVTPFPPSLAFDKQYYLGISFDGNPELAPRTAFSSTPYAQTARVAELAQGLTIDARGVVTSINELAGPLRIAGDSTTTVSVNGNQLTIHSNASGNYSAGQGIRITNGVISATGGLPTGTSNNTTLRWNGSAWTENSNLKSDANGNTEIAGSTTLDNMGHGVVHSSATGLLSASNVDLGNDVIGVLPVANGGTGMSILAAGQLLVGNGTGPITTELLTGGPGISVTQSGNTLTITNTGAIGWGLSGNANTTAGTNFLGTTDNIPFELHVYNNDGAGHGSKRVIRIEPNLVSANIIGGYQGNTVSSGVVGAIIAGGGLNGFNNTITDDFGVVGGGSYNRAGDNNGSTSDANHATVSGGGGNIASAQYASILGGAGNNATATGATLGGGSTNYATGTYSFVGGGAGNVASGNRAVLSGGDQNASNGNFATVSGGSFDSARGDYSTVAGGRNNTVAGALSTVAGGGYLRLSGANSFGFNGGTGSADSVSISTANTAYFGNVNLWLGNTRNAASQLRIYAPQNGGVAFPASSTHYSALTTASQSTDITYTFPTSQPVANQVLSANSISGTGPYSVSLAWVSPSAGTTTSGGWGLLGNSGTTDGTNYLGTTDNVPFTIRVNSNRAFRIQPTSSAPSFSAGDIDNTVPSGISGAFIAGGVENRAGSDLTFIAAGEDDTILASSEWSTIVGGYKNKVSNQVSAIVGGSENSIAYDAAFIGGGYTDSISNAYGGFIGGGTHDLIRGHSGGIVGGVNNVAYLNSFVGAGLSNYAGGVLHAGDAVLGGLRDSAFGDYSGILGGTGNLTALTASNAAIVGGTDNYSGGSNTLILGGGYLRLDGTRSLGFHAGTSSSDSARVSASNIAFFGNADLWLANTNNTASKIKLFGPQNGGVAFPAASTHYTSFSATSQSTDIDYTLPATAPANSGSLLLASSGTSSTLDWSGNLLWDNTNSRLAINTTSPSHVLHSVNSATTDEMSAIYGVASAATSNQAIGVWGDASNTSSTNTGSIGVLATGSGNATAGNTNVALQVNDGELAIGRTTETPNAGSDVEAATGGTAYSQQGPSGIVEFTLGAAGNLQTAAPTSGVIQDLGSVTINNRYTQAGSIVLVSVVAMIDDGTAPNPQNAAWIVNADNATAGSFTLRIKMIPTVTNASNFSANDKVRVGYVIVNKSR